MSNSPRASGTLARAPLTLRSVVIMAMAVVGTIVLILWYLRSSWCLPPTADSFPGGLDPCLKDSIQASLGLTGLIAVAATSWGVINELRKQQITRADLASAEQRAADLRADDLRWRQAQASRTLIQDIHDHPHASVAVQMMDWAGLTRQYHFPDGVVAQVSWDRIRSSVADPQELPEEPTDQLIHCHIIDAFDWFLYYLAQIGHGIDSRLIRVEDVSSTLSPYIERLDLRDPPVPVAALPLGNISVAALMRLHNYRGVGDLRSHIDREHRSQRPAT